MITVISCGASNGPLPHADLSVDCRRMPDPSEFVHDTPGTSPAVGQLIFRMNPLVKDFLDLIVTAVRILADAQDDVQVVLYCSAGWHRSVSAAEYVAAHVRDAGFSEVEVHHRDLKGAA